jgi:Bacterial RNA polymerase, alpha chain C terminal domain
MQSYSDFFKTLHDETSPAGYLGHGTHYSVLRAVVFRDPMGNPLSEGQFADFAVIWDEDHDTRVMEPIGEIYRRGLLSSFLMFGEHKGTFTAIVLDEIPMLDVSLNPELLRKVDELEFSQRTANCLRNDNLVYVGDMVQRSEAEFLRTPNFGRKCLYEIKEVLAQMGLQPGMNVPGWRPANIEKLTKDGLTKHKARFAFLKTEINAICQSLDDSWSSEVAVLGDAKSPIIDDEPDRVSLYLKNLEMLWQLGIRARQPEKPAAFVTAPPRRTFGQSKRPANANGTLPG